MNSSYNLKIKKQTYQKIDRRPTWHFSKEDTDGQQTHEKLLNITKNHQRNGNQTYTEVSPHTG